MHDSAWMPLMKRISKDGGFVHCVPHKSGANGSAGAAQRLPTESDLPRSGVQA
jgi:hypothetical protein